MSPLSSSGIRAVMRGAWRGVLNPRLLAQIGARSQAQQQLAFESEARSILGEVRTVALEHVLRVSHGRVQRFSYLDGTSSIPDLLLLQALAARFKPSRYFEIGTFRGESASAVADTGAQVVTLSLPDASTAKFSDDELRSLAVDKTYYGAHRFFSEGRPEIRHVYGDSAEFDLEPYEGWADVLFIDGDHSREAVERDTKRFRRVLRSDDAIVVWHDAFFKPLQPRWEVIAGIAAGVPEGWRSRLVHISNTQCIACLPEAAELETVERSFRPRLVFTVSVTITDVERT